jgi:hypothetical protein
MSKSHLAVYIFKLLNTVREGDHFGGADESEVEWIEVDDNILPLVVGQGHLLELAVYDGLSLEGGRRLLDLGG